MNKKAHGDDDDDNGCADLMMIMMTVLILTLMMMTVFVLSHTLLERLILFQELFRTRWPSHETLTTM